MSKVVYDYVIVGAGIAGCALAHFLSKKSSSVLLIDKNSDVAFGASGAAGAFLSPLLGKPNAFKDLITKSLSFSVSYYNEHFKDDILNCGTCRIPKNNEDREKFESYKPFMDFDYAEYKDGYLFDIGSVVTPYNICKKLVDDIETKFDYDVKSIEKKEQLWILNGQVETRNLFLTTGANIKLIEEEYFDIRAVWGQKIDAYTSTNSEVNYHKECSLSKGIEVSKNKYKVSIGATHHRFDCNKDICNYCVEVANINSCSRCYTNDITNQDSEKLIKLANDIQTLNDVEVIDVKIGARASSTDYFPMVGKLVDSKKSIEKYPHILNGSFIKEENLEMIDNLYVLNGVGGRGFVLSLYLANELCEHIFNNKKLDDKISTYRLFKRWAKRVKNKTKNNK